MSFLILLPFLIVALTIHEFAHAFVADKLGDPTPRMQGRVTLNPLAHLDPIGTLVLIISSLAGIGFGWGKPVMFNPYNLKHPKRDAGFVAVAGPLSNIIMAIFAVFLLVILNRLNPNTSLSDLTSTTTNLYIISAALTFKFLFINIILAVFNLIPIYPLDGFNVLLSALPHKYSEQFAETSKYGTFLLLILIFTGATKLIIDPIINFVFNIISLVLK